MINFAPSNPVDKHQIGRASLIATASPTGLVLLVAFAMAVYLDSKSPGTSLDQLMSMTAFP
jgi:hypothetical protein